MRVVITGGAGFIGSNLCRQLLETDGIESVAVIDDLSNGNLANLESVLDQIQFEKALYGFFFFFV